MKLLFVVFFTIWRWFSIFFVHLLTRVFLTSLPLLSRCSSFSLFNVVFYRHFPLYHRRRFYTLLQFFVGNSHLPRHGVYWDCCRDTLDVVFACCCRIWSWNSKKSYSEVFGHNRGCRLQVNHDAWWMPPELKFSDRFDERERTNLMR